MNQEILVLIEVLKQQIEKPTRAVVNSESSFVVNKLQKLGYGSIAARYWNAVCMRKVDKLFPIEVAELHNELLKIDSQVSMPSWGYSNT